MSTDAVEAAPATSAVSTDALTVEHVDVAYQVRRRDQAVLRDVSFRIGRGESFGLVGESGCGKSTMALAIVRYLARNGRVSGGSIAIDGQDVLAMNEGALRRLRATPVSMVYQEPGRALNPSLRVGQQVAEVFQIAGKSDKEALELSEEMLRTVRISDPASVMGRYPHQLSGGMLQRTVIAMALASEPSLLILDEPTTALDATVEAEVLDLVKALRQEFGTSLLFISHNLGVIARMCDRVGVLYAGELVEEGPALDVLHDARHPYTVGLLRCIPRRDADKHRHALDTIPGFLPRPGETTSGCIFASRCGLVQDRCRTEAPPLYEIGPVRRSRCHFHERAQTLPRTEPAQTEAAKPKSSDAKPLISARDVGKTFRLSGQEIHGLTDVSLDIMAGETLGLVGESGSGKTTLARVLMGLTAPDAGSSVELDGHALAYLTKKRTRRGAEGPADRVPEPGLGAEPPPLGAPPDRPLAVQARPLHRRGPSDPAGGADPVGAADRSLPADAAQPAVGRAEAAGRDRSSVRRRSPDRRLRRAHVGARCFGAGRDPEPAERSPDPRGRRLPVHQSRSRGGALPVGSHRGAVPGSTDGAGTGRQGLLVPAPPLHRGAAVGGAQHRCGRPAAHPPRR